MSQIVISRVMVQKPNGLTTLGGLMWLNNIYLYIKVLTPVNFDQYFPAKGGQGHWLLQLIFNIISQLHLLQYFILPLYKSKPLPSKYYYLKFRINCP
jgi:hypothetical protein